MATEKKRKRVRKDDKDFENLIFAAFETETILNQKDLEIQTGEPWNFLKPIVEKLCDRHQNNVKGKCWILKPEYRLASDNTTTQNQINNIKQETSQPITFNSDPKNTTSKTDITEPPKKKRKKGKGKAKKSNFWLVKIPNWVHDEWFDDTKYPNCSRLGELYVIPDANDEKKKTMKLEITRPHPQQIPNINHPSHHYNSINPKKSPLLTQFDNIPIPTQFKMEQREQRNRVNVKHGELKITGADKLLVFHDKPPFPVGSHVEALDNSRHNHMDEDDDDDDIKSKNKKKSNGVSLGGYSKGCIKEINNDRTFTVQFNKSKKQRYKVPERDIRFENPQEEARANKCKIWGLINGEMDVTPQWTPQYKQYLQLRSMKKSFQHTMQIKEKKIIYNQSKAERDREAMERINANRRTDKKNVKSNKNKHNTERKAKRVKNVRKDEKLYENMVFAAFEKESCLSQKDMEIQTGEPWNFLRPIVQRLCDRYQNTVKGGRSWVLKAEYRLATDSVIQAPTNNDEQ